jgi:hypothetical protein
MLCCSEPSVAVQEWEDEEGVPEKHGSHHLLQNFCLEEFFLGEFTGEVGGNMFSLVWGQRGTVQAWRQ